MLDRLNAHTVKAGNCWLWVGAWSSGYGVIQIDGKLHRVHRLSAHIHHELDLESSLMALHVDDCPNRNCWNPEHIYIGNASDNTADYMRVKGRKSGPHHKCGKGHILNEENTSTLANGNRRCRVCHNERAKKQRVRQKNRMERWRSKQ